ncbi:hypothetical protein [Sphingomonas sp.]|uniref:hypothetical protein n=1 Tax=Sphingomonas sp. TaxID=28214 RepID=UPI0031D25215
MFVSKKRYQQLETLNAYWQDRAYEAEAKVARMLEPLKRANALRKASASLKRS